MGEAMKAKDPTQIFGGGGAEMGCKLSESGLVFIYEGPKNPSLNNKSTFYFTLHLTVWVEKQMPLT